MQNLLIKATKDSPEINFDCLSNILEIKGKLYPEDAGKFYAAIFQWLNEYLDQLQEQACIINLEIMYFNSSSSKALMNIFDLLDDAAASGKNITVNWKYREEDDNIQESGEEYKEDIEHLKFNMIQL
jgi:hypothetical protein